MLFSENWAALAKLTADTQNWAQQLADMKVEWELQKKENLAFGIKE